MQTPNDNHSDSNTSVDKDALSRAQQLWRNFTLFIKWGIIVCALVLALLGLITL